MIHTSRASLTLTLACFTSIILLTAAHQLAKPRIAQSELAWKMENLRAVLPGGHYDNDPLSTQFQHVEPELGSEAPLDVYVVFQNDQPSAAALEIIAGNGYNGDIRLLLGISYKGEIIGVRVIEHRETPGLGDDIEIRRSDWITQFVGRSQDSSRPTEWEIKRNGGQFDGITGATITPLAIINAVHSALIWFETNKDKLFNDGGFSA
jgi:electron transport complex protein RnfG